MSWLSYFSQGLLKRVILYRGAFEVNFAHRSIPSSIVAVRAVLKPHNAYPGSQPASVRLRYGRSG
jgi:hypothetical protein